MTDEEKPTIVDKRAASKIKYGELDPDPMDTARGNTRLSQVRWPVGEEPYHDVPGTDPNEEWVNVKLEVVEHPDPDPDQRAVLGGGPELKMPCATCGAKMHAAAHRTPKEILEEAGYSFPEGFEFSNEKVIACVCENGHITQLRERFVKALIAD